MSEWGTVGPSNVYVCMRYLLFQVTLFYCSSCDSLGFITLHPADKHTGECPCRMPQASHWWKNKTNDCLCFIVHTIRYRVGKRSSCDISNTPPIHINLVGITGRCGRGGLAMTVLQGGVLWVCSVFVCRGGAVRLLLASLVNGFHQRTGRLEKWNRVIHLVQLPLPAEQSKHIYWIVRKCHGSECTMSAVVMWDYSFRKLITTI